MEKQVAFAFDWEELNKDTFLNKLQSSVKRIEEYQGYLGTDSNAGR